VTLLVDTSVLVTWFHEQGKSEVESARQLLAAHLEGRERVIVLDLVTYELGSARAACPPSSPSGLGCSCGWSGPSSTLDRPGWSSLRPWAPRTC